MYRRHVSAGKLRILPPLVKYVENSTSGVHSALIRMYTVVSHSAISDMATDNQMDFIKNKLLDFIERTFIRENSLYLACNEKHFISSPRDFLKFYRLSAAAFYACINIIYQFIKSFLDDKMSVFDEYGTFKRIQFCKLLCCRMEYLNES